MKPDIFVEILDLTVVYLLPITLFRYKSSAPVQLVLTFVSVGGNLCVAVQACRTLSLLTVVQVSGISFYMLTLVQVWAITWWLSRSVAYHSTC